MKVMVTGKAGYIGSTNCSALLDTGHTPIILDSRVGACELFTEARFFTTVILQTFAWYRRFFQANLKLKMLFIVQH